MGIEENLARPGPEAKPSPTEGLVIPVAPQAAVPDSATAAPVGHHEPHGLVGGNLITPPTPTRIVISQLTPGPLYVGNAWELQATITNPTTGELIEPGFVGCEVTQPNGETENTGSTRLAKGIYGMQQTPELIEPGSWLAVWYSSTVYGRVRTPLRVTVRTAGEQRYAAIADVAALALGRKIGEPGNPTEANVQVYLEMAEAEINAILIDKGYVVPVALAHTQARELLRSITAIGALYFMELASPQSVNLDRATADYTRAKQKLVEAHDVMEAPKNTERSEPRAPFLTYQPGEEVYDPFALLQGEGRTGGNTNPANPYFRRGMTF